MKLFNTLDEIKDIQPTVVALGNFDGVHRGHQELIRRAVKSADIAGLKSAVFTFSNHPKNLINPDSPVVKSILYKEDKEAIMETLGVDYMFNIPFTKDILTMDPISYIDDLLIDKVKMQEAYCGFNYRFGYKAKGDVEALMKEGLAKGLGIHVLEPFKIQGELVSSSAIRQMIEEGDMGKCAIYLGRYYSIGGEVVVGNRLGKSLGFPTSNLVIDENMASPSNGVYVTYCIYNGVKYPSITNVGVKPTVGDFKKNVETHIFDFDKELYGKHIRVEFIKKTRPERKYDSIEALSKQITDDCIMVKAYHRQNQPKDNK